MFKKAFYKTTERLQKLLIGFITAYRWILSPIFGNCCRFYPSCSEYAQEALRKHGVVKGIGLASWRILRCNPYSQGGCDAVPDKKLKEETQYGL